MSFNYTLRYRTFDQLMAEASIDFQNYDLENFIEPQQMIKVAKRVNYDLGLRVNQTKEAVLELRKGNVKLPDNFYTLNYALLCGEYTIQTVLPQGTHIEEVPLYRSTPAQLNTCTDGPVNCGTCDPNPCQCSPCCEPESPCEGLSYNPLEPYGDTCNKPRVYMNCKGDCYELVQHIKTETRVYKRFASVSVVNNPQTIECDCPNLYMNTSYKIWIKDGFLYSNVDEGNLYISYQGMMEDDEGNLLVPDHDLLNEYYEYAVKQRILENLIMNDEPVSQAKIQLIEARYREARNKALGLVNTPNFAEMKQVWQLNRKAQYSKYYDMFKSYNFATTGSLNRVIR